MRRHIWTSRGEAQRSERVVSNWPGAIELVSQKKRLATACVSWERGARLRSGALGMVASVAVVLLCKHSTTGSGRQRRARKPWGEGAVDGQDVLVGG